MLNRRAVRTIATPLIAMTIAGGAHGAAAGSDASAPQSAVVSRIQQFLKQQNAAAPGPVTVTVHARSNQTAPCHDPQPALTGAGHRTTGRLTVVVICPDSRPRRRYYQTDVTVTAGYWVAARNLPADRRITPAMLRRSRGEITHLRGPLVFDRHAIVGQVTRRRINKDTPINQRMLAAPKVVQRGQPVEIIVRGSGFSISTRGKALRAVEKNKSVRVRTENGRIVTGIANGDGRVIIRR